MSEPDNADWIAEVMALLVPPDAALVRDILEHMAALRGSLPVECAPRPACPTQSANADPQSAPPGHSEREHELQSCREALYAHLRDSWTRARGLPRSVKHVQILRETAALAVHSHLLEDPLAEDVKRSLTSENAKAYASEAVARAEELGDTLELIEACLVLGSHHYLAARFGEAQQCGHRVIALARQIHSLRHEAAGYGLLCGTATLADPCPRTQEALLRRKATVLEKVGNAFEYTQSLLELARLHVVGNQLTLAEAVLARAAGVLDTIDVVGTDRENHRDRAEGMYHRCCAQLRYAQGRQADAVAEMRSSVSRSFGYESYRFRGLAADLAFLEDLYRRRGDQWGFLAFCRDLGERYSVPLKQWHLEPELPPQVEWSAGDALSDPSLRLRRHWIDPLHKGAYALKDGLEITPVIGAGFLSNVSAPRLMLDVSGDFTFEATIDWRGNLTRAGGILVYQDDETLVRFGAGIHHDHEVTLTVKSPRQGFHIAGRGLLTQGTTTVLRIARRGRRFRAWCSDGQTWYRSGHADVEVGDEVQVGLFAECTYRDWLSPTRCTATAMRFAEARLQVSGSPRLSMERAEGPWVT